MYFKTRIPFIISYLDQEQLKKRQKQNTNHRENIIEAKYMVNEADEKGLFFVQEKGKDTTVISPYINFFQNGTSKMYIAPEPP